MSPAVPRSARGRQASGRRAPRALPPRGASRPTGRSGRAPRGWRAPPTRLPELPRGASPGQVAQAGRTSSTRSGVGDARGRYGRPEPVVDVDDGNSGGATVEHGKQRGDSAEAGAVADARRNRDHRGGYESSDDRRE